MSLIMLIIQRFWHSYVQGLNPSLKNRSRQRMNITTPSKSIFQCIWNVPRPRNFNPFPNAPSLIYWVWMSTGERISLKEVWILCRYQHIVPYLYSIYPARECPYHFSSWIGGKARKALDCSAMNKSWSWYSTIICEDSSMIWSVGSRLWTSCGWAADEANVLSSLG